MPTFERSTCSIATSQIGFLDYIVSGMMEAWEGMFLFKSSTKIRNCINLFNFTDDFSIYRFTRTNSEYEKKSQFLERAYCKY